MKKGFTLIELLVVIAVLALMGAIILVVFTNSLRGGNKAQIISVIKQNGQKVLENMDKTIRNSDRVVCPSFLTPTNTTTSLDTIVTVKEGNYTMYRFIPPNSTDLAKGDCKSVNGCAIYEIFTLPSSPPPGADPNLYIRDFENTVCLRLADLQNVQITTDTNPQTGISVENGLFTRVRKAGYKDLIQIKFDLKPGLQAPQAVSGQIDPVTFKTTVELR